MMTAPTAQAIPDSDLQMCSTPFGINDDGTMEQRWPR